MKANCSAGPVTRRSTTCALTAPCSPQRNARCSGPAGRARRSSAPVDLVDGRGVVVAFRDISARVRLGEVEASRARIAKAADDARREIERDLHDGAQQQFVAVAMRLENARRLIQTDPADAARLVDAAHADLREAIAELRRLAHGIHPAELSRRGLTAALRTLARRAAIPVDLKAEDVGRLPPQTRIDE